MPLNVAGMWQLYGRGVVDVVCNILTWCQNVATAQPGNSQSVQHGI